MPLGVYSKPEESWRMEERGREVLGGEVRLWRIWVGRTTSCTCILFCCPKLGLFEPSENVAPL
jgi:hypothetical protein